jgi:photosynthetic reaction center M subunit
MLEFESAYRKPGNTLLRSILGTDPFDWWAGRFYVGLWGVVTILAIGAGVGVLFIAVGQYGD